MLRLLSLDFEFLISAGLVIFLVIYLLHIFNIIKKGRSYKWNTLEEGRYFIPLLIYIILFIVKSILPIDNIGYAKYLVWLLIFASFIIYKLNPLLIFEKKPESKNK